VPKRRIYEPLPRPVVSIGESSGPVVQRVRYYHYSSLEGILGITHSHELWASHVYFLNDALEVSYALDLARKHIRDIVSQSEFSSQTEECVATIANMQRVNVCVFSLSEERDLLSHWRAYGGVGGCAIGFDAERLTEVAAEAGFSLHRCVYARADQERILHETFVKCLQEYRETRSEQQAPTLQGLIRTDFLAVAATIKNPSFSEEREWRLVSEPKALNRESWGIRRGASFLAPYYRLALGDRERSPIAEIVVGPTPNPDLSAYSIVFLRETTGLRIAIGKSSIPYRTW
jgi:hypothetical protein